MNFSVEEENLICMYHTSDRRRTMARIMAALTDRGLISRVSDTASLTMTHYF